MGGICMGLNDRIHKIYEGNYTVVLKQNANFDKV